jgi:UTP--glucose-1-phosphate uridylyltransferase
VPTRLRLPPRSNSATMKVRKALVTAANPRQRALPLQMLIDQQGEPKSALQIILEEAAGAGVEEFCAIVCPGDETAYAGACGALRERVRSTWVRLELE